jgi:4-oxalocrotonate tautomerase
VLYESVLYNAEIPQNNRETAMPNIIVQMARGRTTDQKRKLAKALTDATVEVLGVNPEWVSVIMQEVEKDGWAVGGELLFDRFHRDSDEPAEANG